MNRKELVNTVKNLLLGEQEEVVEEVFVDVKTEDGRIMRVADIAVDQPVKEITEDGEVDVEDATYVLEDGTSIVVVAGVITEIVEAEAEAEEEVVEEMAKDEVVEDKEEEKEEEVKLEEEEESFEDVLSKALGSIAERLDAIESKFEKVEGKVEEFGKVASANHTETELKFKKVENSKPKSKLHTALGK